MKIRRGDILRVDLGIHPGSSIQSGIRPVVVVSNNKANDSSTVITVIPLSTKMCKSHLPTHVFLNACFNRGLDRNSIALAEQIIQIDSQKIMCKLGSINEADMESITLALQIQVGVFSEYN